MVVAIAAIPLVLLARAGPVGAPLLVWRKSLPYGSTMPLTVWASLASRVSVDRQANFQSVAKSGEGEVLIKSGVKSPFLPLAMAD